MSLYFHAQPTAYYKLSAGRPVSGRPALTRLEREPDLELHRPRRLIGGGHAEARAPRKRERRSDRTVRVVRQVQDRGGIGRTRQRHRGVSVGDGRLIERVEHVQPNLQGTAAAELNGSRDREIERAHETAPHVVRP